jgi:hypothetical protein
LFKMCVFLHHQVSKEAQDELISAVRDQADAHGLVLKKKAPRTGPDW